MRILYYMPVYAGTLQERFDRIAQRTYRGELLYGAPELRNLGHTVILPPPYAIGGEAASNRGYKAIVAASPSVRFGIYAVLQRHGMAHPVTGHGIVQKEDSHLASQPY